MIQKPGLKPEDRNEIKEFLNKQHKQKEIAKLSEGWKKFGHFMLKGDENTVNHVFDSYKYKQRF
jgi:hypothetical protein